MTELSVEQKVYQMFILGYEGENPRAVPEFRKALNSGLGGVIFFTHNICEKERFKQAVKIIKEESAILPPFLSIDQEGGRVERTLNLYGGHHYKSARDVAKQGENVVLQQAQWISEELKYLGINMNFAPVLDVDTNPDNPVIADRSYSSNCNDVIKYGKITAKTYLKNGIIPVGKHFPGHGDTSVDSHKDLPEVALNIKELEDIHIKPFKELLEYLPAIMVAHVHYKAFNNEKIPASVSNEVIEKYLRGKLNYQGVVISDDMVMGGIRHFSPFEACKKGIESGVNMFIYRNADDSVIQLIEDIISAVKRKEIDINKINRSVECIKRLKNVAKL